MSIQAAILVPVPPKKKSKTIIPFAPKDPMQDNKKKQFKVELKSEYLFKKNPEPQEHKHSKDKWIKIDLLHKKNDEPNCPSSPEDIQCTVPNTTKQPASINVNKKKEESIMKIPPPLIKRSTTNENTKINKNFVLPIISMQQQPNITNNQLNTNLSKNTSNNTNIVNSANPPLAKNVSLINPEKPRYQIQKKHPFSKVAQKIISENYDGKNFKETSDTIYSVADMFSMQEMAMRAEMINAFMDPTDSFVPFESIGDYIF